MIKTLRVQQSLVHLAWAMSLLRFSNGLTGVFIPLVILQHGGKLWMVAAFYLFYSVFKLAINFPLMRLILRFGASTALALGFVASALEVGCIFGFSQHYSLAWLVGGAISLSIANGCIWNSQHYYISNFAERATRSSSLATMEVLGQVADITGPLLGGLIGSVLGAGWLLASGVAVALLALLPLRNLQIPETVQNLHNLRYSLRGAPASDTFANFCFNVEACIGTLLWPIYLAVILKTYNAIGSIAALAAAATCIMLLIAGHRGDKGKDRSVMRQGIAVNSGADVARIFALTPLSIAVVSAVYKASLFYMINAWASTYYDHAKRLGPQYIMSMEIACDLGYTAIWGLLLVVLLVSSSTRLFFVVSFVVAAIAAWGCLLLRPMVRQPE